VTHLSTINIKSNKIVKWMNVLRSKTGAEQERVLECFWDSQISSKAWLINVFKSLNIKVSGSVYIFGGWYGILASLIKDELHFSKVFSVDIDPTCEKIGTELDCSIKFLTYNMSDFVFDTDKIGLVINTSTEHISQATFDSWLSKIPDNVPIILQGNDFFSCKEHVRCTESLEMFVRKNYLHKIVYKGVLDCKQFNRFMIIGYKNDN
jgi:hypothetical protein